MTKYPAKMCPQCGDTTNQILQSGWRPEAGYDPSMRQILCGKILCKCVYYIAPEIEDMNDKAK